MKKKDIWVFVGKISQI